MTTQNDISPFLQVDRIEKIHDRLSGYAEKFAGRLPYDDIEHARYLVKKYAVCTSVIIGLLGDRIKGKKVLEVGPGYAGRFLLDYLVEEGADAIGTDPSYDYRDYTGPSQGRYVSFAMENLSEGFGPDSFNLINIMSMHPDPVSREVREIYLFGKFFQRIKANRYYKKYPTKISHELERILKPEERLLLWSKTDDFRLNPNHLINRGLTHNSMDIPLNIIQGMFRLDIYQKQVVR